jgi:hypothetical protein
MVNSREDGICACKYNCRYVDYKDGDELRLVGEAGY